jgi:hypothetical protein
VGDCTSERAGLSRRGLLRGAVGAGGLAAVGASLVLGAERSAAAAGAISMAPPELPIHSRASWGAVAPTRSAAVLGRSPDHIVIHHTASKNTADGSLEQAYRLSRSIQRSHMRGRGWDDVGQHFTVSRGGYMLEGRNRTLEVIAGQRRFSGFATGFMGPREVGHVVGAHTLHHNTHTVGIENEGTYTRAAVPEPLWRSLAELCAWLCIIYELDPQEAIVGHRDFNPTSCPGDVLYAGLPALRRNVARLLSA